MKKLEYNEAEIELVIFENVDVVTESDPTLPDQPI